MNVQQLYELLENKEDIEPSYQSDLKALIDQYPYFQPAVFLYLKLLYLYNITLFRTELERLSVSLSERKALFFFIMSEEYKGYALRTNKKELPVDKSAALLDAFFETHDAGDNALQEYTLIHSTLASSDYFAYVENVEKTIMDKPAATENRNFKHQEIIDSFIQKSEEGTVRITLDTARNDSMDNLPKEEEELDDDMFFTETLAKIYIKQRKYEKAYKIIEHLSLNYPKKNVYFADQLNFLEKLIINSKYKDKK